jgi:hypothetical protein
LRESCVRFTEAADASFFFRRLYLLLAALFGKIEDMFLLWKAGTLPAPPVRAPRQTSNAPAPSRAPRQRHSTTRRPKSASSTARPIRVRRRAAYHTHATPQLKPDAPARRIDRYPKP